MSEQDTSQEPLIASNQPTNTGRNPSEPATSSNKQGGQSTLLTILGVITFVSWVVYFCTGAERNDPKVHWLPISLMLTIIFVIILFLCKKLWVFKNISQFNSWIFGVTLIGGTIAFLLPLGIANDFAKDGEGTTLRQMLIYTTGGLLGVITLSETRRKNDLEESKFDEQQIQFREGLVAQKDNLTTQLTSQENKDKRDHAHQVHAERRSRYAKAVEQLGNKNAAIRFGGIYTLVGLVDEWLADDVLNHEEEQKEGQKEGQVIINNLCSYIRSPFPLAEKIDEYKAYKKLEELKEKESKSPLGGVDSFEFKALRERFPNPQDYKKPKDIATAQATFSEEQDVRRTIFVEMSKRSSNISKEEGKVIKPVPGKWSDFDFDFSRAPIFYPLNDLTIEQGNFSGAKVYIDADFRGVNFPHTSNFSEATFTHNANFSEATFNDNADFRGARFAITPNFSEVKFTSTAKFDKATFTRDVNFIKAAFSRDVSFDGAIFTHNVNFSRATFARPATFIKAVFTHNANFSGARFTCAANFSGARFTHDAHFSEATFTRRVNFSEAKFTHDANFGGATFTHIVDFTKARFTHEANFGGATFLHRANFNRATFTHNANFRRATFTNFIPTFATKLEHAQFSASSNPQDYKLSLLTPDSKTIKLKTATLLGKTFKIPHGTVLFDPMSPKNKDGNYSGLSDPAGQKKKNPTHK